MLMEAASYYGSLSILLVLLQHSADPDLQNSHGFNALMMAAEAGHEACVQVVLCTPKPTPSCSPTRAEFRISAAFQRCTGLR